MPTVNFPVFVPSDRSRNHKLSWIKPIVLDKKRLTQKPVGVAVREAHGTKVKVMNRNQQLNLIKLVGVKEFAVHAGLSVNAVISFMSGAVASHRSTIRTITQSCESLVDLYFLVSNSNFVLS